MSNRPVRTANPAVLLFGAYRRAVLARLLLRPEESVYVRELAREMGKPAGTLLRELNALAQAGVLQRTRAGNQVRFQADPRCPIHEDLRNILKKTVGVADVLREALATLGARVRAAFIYGSVAGGDERPGSDLDLLVVGDAEFVDVVEALAPAQNALRREVNPMVLTALEMGKKAGEPFLKHVLAGPKIFIVGGEDDLGKPGAHRQAQGARRRTATGRRAT
jgi:predicted nucleotidyltransferase